LARVVTGVSVENLDTVQVKLAVVRQPFVLTCFVAFEDVEDMSIANHSMELFA
jgi:hypothetical protein